MAIAKTMTTQKILYIAACFISGVAIMVIELSGIRLLAPVFGNSLYTWTALIGVVLVAVSVGGFIGGYLADKTTNPHVIVVTLVASAAFIIIVPTLHAISASKMSRYGIVYGPSILSFILFVVPGAMLGLINPYATRLLAKLSDDKKIGAATGAANTAGALGSFIGTFIAGFYLVPHMDVRRIFMLTALVLVLLGVLIILSVGVRLRKRQVITYSGMLLVALAVSSSLHMSYGPGVVTVTNSKYQQIMVFEKEVNGVPNRFMINNGQPQGGVNIETMKSTMGFQQYWKIIEQYKPDIATALMVGGGTFSVPQDIKNNYPDAEITVLEIDEKVVDIALQYFNLDKYPDIKVVTSDARWYTNNNDTLYDFIFVDAYNGNNALPSHLATVEYFNSLKTRLAPNGLIMMNVLGNESGPMSSVFGSIYNSFGSVFGEVDVYRTPLAHESHKATNLILLASVDGTIPNATRPASKVVSQYMSTIVADENILVDNAPILTDNRNPLDVLAGMMAIEHGK